MVPRPLAPAQAMRSRICPHVFQPCRVGVLDLLRGFLGTKLWFGYILVTIRWYGLQNVCLNTEKKDRAITLMERK